MNSVIEQNTKIIKRRIFDLGKDTCSFSSMSYCIIDKETSSYASGHYRLQLCDCNHVYFYSDSDSKRTKRIVIKLIDCIIKTKLLIKNNKNVTRRWNLTTDIDVVFSQNLNIDSVFKLVNSERVIKLDNNETYVHPKKTFFILHATNIVVEDFQQNYVDVRNKKHLLLRLDRLHRGLADFIESINKELY